MINLLKKSKSLQEAYDRFIKTLCNQTRLAIIHTLINKPKNVTQLTDELKIHQSSVSHGLKRLLICGFVIVEKKGKERFYSVNKKTIKPLMKLMENHVSKYCVKGVCK